MEGLGWLKENFLSWTLESSPVSGCSLATLFDLDILAELALGLSVAGLDFRVILRVELRLSV